MMRIGMFLFLVDSLIGAACFANAQVLAFHRFATEMAIAESVSGTVPSLCEVGCAWGGGCHWTAATIAVTIAGDHLW